MYCWNFNFENSVILEVLIFNCRSYLELSQVGSKFRVLTSYPYHTQFTKTEGITDKKLCIYQFTQRALTEHLQRTDNFPNDESYLHVTFTFSSNCSTGEPTVMWFTERGICMLPLLLSRDSALESLSLSLPRKCCDFIHRNWLHCLRTLLFFPQKLPMEAPCSSFLPLDFIYTSHIYFYTQISHQLNLTAFHVFVTTVLLAS